MLRLLHRFRRALTRWNERLAPGEGALLNWWWASLLLLVVVGGAVWLLNPAPPDRLVIAAGPSGGVYDQYARRYAERLRRQGLKVEVLNSTGSAQNLEWLLGKGKRADAALVQGGVTLPEAENERVNTLGSVAYEPVWVFYRGNFEVDKLRQLQGWRISVGADGTGLRGLATQLLDANEIPLGERMIALSGLNAAEAIQQSQIDAAFVIASADSPVVQVLLRSPNIRLMSFSQADAYRHKFPFLSKLVLPQGAADLVRDFPPVDTTLLATTTNLVVNSDLHPALQSQLLQVAADVHRDAGFFHARGEFPSVKDQSFAVSPEADRYYRSGPPFLQRYLPFWAAVLVDRLVFLLLPLIAVLLPAMRVAPAIYRWRVRARIFRCYGDLKFLENELRTRYDPARREAYMARLDSIEDDAYRRKVPLGFTDLVYTLREHVDLVRRMLDRLTMHGTHPANVASEAGRKT
jgi:TRAP transporter TAXI family solute receptor